MVSSVVPVFNNVRESSKAKNYHPVSLPSVVSLVFGKSVNNKIVNYLNKLLMMLSIILLSMLMIVLSTLSAIRHLICGNN